MTTPLPRNDANTAYNNSTNQWIWPSWTSYQSHASTFAATAFPTTTTTTTTTTTASSLTTTRHLHQPDPTRSPPPHLSFPIAFTDTHPSHTFTLPTTTHQASSVAPCRLHAVPNTLGHSQHFWPRSSTIYQAHATHRSQPHRRHAHHRPHHFCKPSATDGTAIGCDTWHMATTQACFSQNTSARLCLPASSSLP